MNPPNPQRLLRAKRNCCVVDCWNSEKKNPDLQFYRFPGRKCDVRRKEMWVKAIDRIDKNNVPWYPKSHSCVCSTHFVGGKKSDDYRNEAYIPTIFPDGRNVRYTPAASCGHPEKRLKLETPNDEPSFQNPFEIVNVKCEEPESVTSTIGCQTDPWFDQPENEINVLYCWTSETESSTQTEIFIQKPEPPKKIVVIKPVTKVDKVCGSDEEMNPSLWRFLEITTDSTMRQLTGVSIEFFLTLLTLIIPNKSGQPSYFRKVCKQDRLFLFLLKLKLGLSFAALGCLFHVHACTASRIFFQTLDTLVIKTKDWIGWPPRESVRKSVPSTFGRYPNLRCILACQEIYADTPPSAEQRIAMYCEKEGGSSIKFLLAITPDGYICQISKGYGGASTNRFITEDSGFLDIIEKDDVIIADKSFADIADTLSKLNASLVIPQVPLYNYVDSEIDGEAKKTPAKIHTNRAIMKIKMFRILDLFSVELLQYKESIMHVCCVIVNARPLVKIEGFSS